MVPSHVEVDHALQRKANGTIVASVEGKTFVLMSTVAQAYSSGLGASLAMAGARYVEVEAPVSGSKQPAETGQLVILAAAVKPAHINDVQPLFDAVGKKTIRCGTIPTAMRMKLANQILLIAYFEAITEATHFAAGIGLDVARFLDMAQAGPLANDVLRMKAPKMLTDDFAQQAPIRHVAKYIGLVCDEAAERGLWVPVAEVNRTLFSEALHKTQVRNQVKVYRSNLLVNIIYIVDQIALSELGVPDPRNHREASSPSSASSSVVASPSSGTLSALSSGRQMRLVKWASRSELAKAANIASGSVIRANGFDGCSRRVGIAVLGGRCNEL